MGALDENLTRRQSALGLFTRFSRSLGLHQTGFGTGHMISYGAVHDPEHAGKHAMQAGVFNVDTGDIEPLDEALINEHVRHSWFRPYQNGKHPSKGETVPDYQPESDRYTWAKAPRYGERVMQTGPLAELVIGGDKLVQDIHQKEGGSTWLRQFARLRRIGHSMWFMRRIVSELASDIDAPFFNPPSPGQECDGQGAGLIQAARGGLGHWVSIKDGVVDRYQIITPTAWNASPKDSNGRHGHWEQSVLGLAVDDLDNPLMVGHVIRSHDPCLVCTVHMLPTGKRIRYGV